MSSLVPKIPITPIALGASLWLLSRGPASARAPILDQLSSILSASQIDSLLTAIRNLFVVDAVAESALFVNSLLSNFAYNNFRLPQTNQWDWPNEIALVTGGASGLGKGFTLELARRGLRVVTLDISDAPAEFAGNARITHFKCNVTDREALRGIAKQVQSTIGHPSILVNNAGIANAHSILAAEEDRLQRLMNVNLICHWYTVQEFLPHMLAVKKGHILSIASAASFIAGPGMVDYSAAKAAVEAFHEGLGSELRGFYNCPEILTTIVHPKWVLTPMTAEWATRLEKGGQTLMTPKVIVDAVVGQIFSCTGGRIVIGSGTGFLQFWRACPRWLTWLIGRTFEGGRMGREIDDALKDKKSL